jgi:hypothetical protein
MRTRRSSHHDLEDITEVDRRHIEGQQDAPAQSHRREWRGAGARYGRLSWPLS